MTLVADLRLALRRFRRHPAVPFAIVVSLALGLGANSAIFALVDALLLRPLAGVAAPDRLIAVFATSDRRPDVLRRLSYEDARDLAGAEGPWVAVTAWAASAMSLEIRVPGAGGISERVIVQGVMPDYFATLGARPAAGRFFSAAETARVAVMSERFARRRFADPASVSREILVNGQAVTLVGVAGRRFFGSDTTAAADLWLPLDAYLDVARGAIAQFSVRDRRQPWLGAIARLAPGVRLAEAQSQLDVLAKRFADSYPDSNVGRGFRAAPLGEVAFGEGARKTVVRYATLLMALVASVWIVTCFDVATLLAAGALERRREVAVRLALGAGRGSLFRLFFAEALLLALAAGAAAVGFAHAALPALERLELPVEVELELGLGPRLLLFTFLIAMASALSIGLTPALRASGGALLPALRGGPHSRRGALRDLAVVAQTGVALVITIGAGLFLLDLSRLEAIDPGFDSDRVATASLDLAAQGYAGPRVVHFYDELLRRLGRLPGVEQVSMAAGVPLMGTAFAVELTVTPEAYLPPPGDAAPPAARHALVGSGYFATTGIPLVRGRDFAARDGATATAVVIVNETLARRFWPGREPLGRHLNLIQTEEPFEVVGVVADSRHARLTEDVEPVLYLHHAQAERSYPGPILAPNMTLLLRTAAGSPGAGDLAAALRRTVREMDPHVPVWNVRPLRDVLSGATALERQTTALFGLFAMLALGLALLGLYGTLTHAVTGRRQELAVRVACGAAPPAILRWVLRRSLVLVGAGLALGLAAASWLGPFVEAQLYGVSTRDPGVWAAAVTALLALTVAVSIVPARRAMRREASSVLRETSS